MFGATNQSIQSITTESFRNESNLCKQYGHVIQHIIKYGRLTVQPALSGEKNSTQILMNAHLAFTRTFFIWFFF